MKNDEELMALYKIGIYQDLSRVMEAIETLPPSTKKKKPD